MGKCTSKGALIILNLIVDCWIQVDDCGKFCEEDVEKRMAPLLVPFMSGAHAIIGGVDPKTRCTDTWHFCSVI